VVQAVVVEEHIMVDFLVILIFVVVVLDIIVFIVLNLKPLLDMDLREHMERSIQVLLTDIVEVVGVVLKIRVEVAVVEEVLRRALIIYLQKVEVAEVV
jgi:hypothetical protein